jgi:hypothetical protein
MLFFSKKKKKIKVRMNAMGLELERLTPKKKIKRKKGVQCLSSIISMPMQMLLEQRTTLNWHKVLCSLAKEFNLITRTEV